MPKNRRPIAALFVAIAALLSTTSPVGAVGQPVVFITQWGTTGTGTSQFDTPIDVAVDPATGNVFVADLANHRVQVFTADGAFVRSWNHMGRVLLGELHAIAIGGNNVYVEDVTHEVIAKFTTTGTFLTSWPAPTHDSTVPNFPGRKGLVADASGNVFAIKDTNHVVKFSPTGTVLGDITFPSGSGPFVTGIALAGSFVVGSMFPARHVVRMTQTGQVAMDVAVSVPSNAFLNGVEVEPNGNIWVTDTQNDKLYQFTSNLVLRQAVGQTGTGPLQFNFPAAPASNSVGVLFVADVSNDRIQKIAESATLTIVVNDDFEGSGPDYSFTVTNGPTAVSPFTLDDDSDPTFTDTKLVSQLIPGTYRVTETSTRGFPKTITCSNGVQTANWSTNFVDLTIPAGSSITCTFYTEFIA